MKKKLIIALVAIAALVSSVLLVTSRERLKAHRALMAYQAKLRGQGEKLTFEEAGYPFPLETNANLEHFVALADRLRTKSSLPGSMEVMRFTAPGRAVVAWAQTSLPPGARDTNASAQLNWENLAGDMQSAAPLLAELRAELEHPPRYFGWNYTNPFNMTPKNPFVQKRAVAQFLTADCLCALHEHQPSRAQTDLHALTQLVQVHRGDLTLVSAMIRVAISGLALSATWEALPAEGWDEASLRALQQDWERIDLFVALEQGFTGERLFGEQAFALMRQADLNAQRSMLALGTASQASSLTDLRNRAAGLYWRGHIDDDELFFLQHAQQQVETIRDLERNASGVRVRARVRAQFNEFEHTMNTPLQKYRHLFSAVAVPNYTKAFEVVIRDETQRRMTITVIALLRFQRQNGHYPVSLTELTPPYLAKPVMDPWSGKPLHYRRNADGTFTLYSVGEDGRDDGGDPTPRVPGQKIEFWSGKDVVWPAAVWPESPK
jgi:hypothetical protein